MNFLGYDLARSLLEKHKDDPSGSKAWSEAYNSRFYKDEASNTIKQERVIPGTESEERRNAEHYLEAYSAVKKNPGLYEEVIQASMTLGWGLYKVTTSSPSNPNSDELKSGIYGAYDGNLEYRIKDETFFYGFINSLFDDLFDILGKLKIIDLNSPLDLSREELNGLMRDPTYCNTPPIDPLILDLNGDGISTIGSTGKDGAMFDFNNDGLRTASGWVAPTDGLLVWDRNNDGSINSGLELFGDATVLQDGSVAAHGFAALADLDSNGDGVINHLDAEFYNLKVWVDKNSDGITDEGELKSLADLGIIQLNLVHEDNQLVQYMNKAA